jgi:PqqD family protein of HPr-rel-A system
MSPSPLRWHALDAATLSRRAWPDEDELVVFNARSGDLHLLNPSANDVLEYLAATPASLGELALRFPDLDAAALESLVESFDALGLIHPVGL